jgi:hypothetical protein
MMNIRFFALIAVFCFALSAHAGDGPEPYPGPGQQPVPPPPVIGFCDGQYDGFLAAQAGPIQMEIQQTGDQGEISVIAHWEGNTWVGRGFCQQVSPCQANVVFQYPNTPVERGMLSVTQDGQAELDGQVDGGDSFRLIRH